MQTKLQISSKHLISLFQSKKIKQFSAYLQYLDDQRIYQSVEKYIVQALTNNLVQKKSTPTGIFYALLFYKIMLVNAKIDFFEYQEIFPNKIHEAVFQICRYNFQESINNRGQNYFIDKIKIKRSEEVEKFGNAFVCLALEIVMNFGHWYPIGFLDEKKSKFALAYEKLKKDGIHFPEYGKFIIMKEKDKGIFETSYKKFLEKYDFQGSNNQTPHEKNHQTPQGNHITQSENYENHEIMDHNVGTSQTNYKKKHQGESNLQNKTKTTNIHSELMINHQKQVIYQNKQQQTNLHHLQTKEVLIAIPGKQSKQTQRNSMHQKQKKPNSNIQTHRNLRNTQPAFILDNKNEKKQTKNPYSSQISKHSHMEQRYLDVTTNKQQILQRNKRNVTMSWIKSACESASGHDLKIEFGLENPEVNGPKSILDHEIEALNKRVVQLQEQNELLRKKSYKISHNSLNRTERTLIYNPKISHSIKSIKTHSSKSKGIAKVEKIDIKNNNSTAIKNPSTTYRTIQSFKAHNLII